MKVGIMQPYFVPYIGYWQLMNAVDQYVIYDDVNYITNGWIHRNRIIVNGKDSFFNLPLKGASCNKKINEVSVDFTETTIKKHLRTIEFAYKKSPYYDSVYPLLEKIIRFEEKNLALFLMHSFQVIKEYLDINTEMILSSQIKKDNSLKGEEKVLAICQKLSATTYYNAIGGRDLYSFSNFKKKDIELKFVQTRPIEYPQSISSFIPNLSIIDVMMNNSVPEIQRMLSEYDLIGETSVNADKS